MKLEELNNTIGSKSMNFGLEVQVRRSVRPKQDSNAASGSPNNETPESSSNADARAIAPGNQNFRNVIPPGRIGTPEYFDPQLPPPQYVDTAAWTRDEEKAPNLHGAIDAEKSAGRTPVFQDYAKFQPRRAAMPRARQDDGFLGSPVTMSADPQMTDYDSSQNILPSDVKRKDLYGENRDGVLHNDNPVPQMQTPTLVAPTVRRPTTSMKGEPRGNQRAKR